MLELEAECGGSKTARGADPAVKEVYVGSGRTGNPSTAGQDRTPEGKDGTSGAAAKLNLRASRLQSYLRRLGV